MSTAPPRPDASAPACRIGEHRMCPGPHVVRRPGAPEWERPVETYRCGCLCHRR